MVIFEAARAICGLRDVSARELAPAITVLQLFLSSSKPVLRFAAVRALNRVAMSHPMAVSEGIFGLIVWVVGWLLLLGGCCGFVLGCWVGLLLLVVGCWLFWVVCAVCAFAVCVLCLCLRVSCVSARTLHIPLKHNTTHRALLNPKPHQPSTIHHEPQRSPTATSTWRASSPTPTARSRRSPSRRCSRRVRAGEGARGGEREGLRAVCCVCAHLCLRCSPNNNTKNTHQNPTKNLTTNSQPNKNPPKLKTETQQNKTKGNEASVDKLLKQIGGFMGDIADDFKIVVVSAIRSLCLKFPAKHRSLMAFLSGVLREVRFVCGCCFVAVCVVCVCARDSSSYYCCSRKGCFLGGGRGRA